MSDDEFEASHRERDTPSPTSAGLRRQSEKAEAVAAFVTEHGRWPRIDGRDVPHAEHLLGSWLVSKRSRYRGATVVLKPLPPQYVEVYDRIIPGWNVPHLASEVHLNPVNRKHRCVTDGCANEASSGGYCADHQNLRPPRVPQRVPNWTNDELRLARDVTLTAAEVAARIARTPGAVEIQRTKIGKTVAARAECTITAMRMSIRRILAGDVDQNITQETGLDAKQLQHIRDAYPVLKTMTPRDETELQPPVRKYRTPAGKSVGHGIAGYQAGCRCVICKRAHMTEYAGRRQARTARSAIRSRARWTDEEDHILSTSTQRVEDLAIQFGRTYAAIINRRVALEGIDREGETGYEPTNTPPALGARR